MCWTSKYPPIKRNAQNHIIVYKVVRHIDSSECRSLYYKWFKYVYKRVYRDPDSLEIKESRDMYGWEIYRGFHSYATMDRALRGYKDAITYVCEQEHIHNIENLTDSLRYQSVFDKKYVYSN